MTKQKSGLTGTALKTIALVLMVMDHIHYFLNLRALCRNGSACWRGCPHHCFCSALWRASPTPMTAGATFCASGPSLLRWARWNFFMIYAGAFRRGDGFYPLNAIFQDLMLLCIIWQGIDWLRQRRFVAGRTGCCHADPLAVLHHSIADAFPKNSGRADLLLRVGVAYHGAVSHVDGHHRWRLVFSGRGIVLYALYNHKRLRLVFFGRL